MKQIKLGIIGPGSIADVVMEAIAGKVDLIRYAVASRDINKAQEFAKKHQFQKSYGSYQELYEDKEVDLVYIATPHAFHYEQMKEAIQYKKHILCEKVFVLHKAQAEEIFRLSKENQVYVAEAMLTPYLPSTQKIKTLLEQGVIGKVLEYKGVFANDLMHVERVVTKSLGGGALLDIGIYPLQFAFSLFGHTYELQNIKIQTYHEIDQSTAFTLEFSSGVKAHIYTSIHENLGIYCEIIGTKGRMFVENVARPSAIHIYDANDVLQQSFEDIRNTSGYEYEFQATVDAISSNQLENAYMRHQDSIYLMDCMDQVLKSIR